VWILHICLDELLLKKNIFVQIVLNMSISIFILQANALYLALENLALWAMSVPYCGGQSSPALPENLLQEFEVN